MTAAQAIYPLIALTELAVLLCAGRSRAQNAIALRLWLAAQILIFFILEPLSLRNSPNYASVFLICSLVSDLADLVVLASIFYGLEDGLPAFGRIRSWAPAALFAGLTIFILAALPLPVKATGIKAWWVGLDQAFIYVRAVALIALGLYGWLRASSWPRDLAWTWLGMASFSFTWAIVERVQILTANMQLLEIVTSLAAMTQVVGLWRALSYAPKPLSPLEMEAAQQVCQGIDQWGF